jgi:hypothetical protein
MGDHIVLLGDSIFDNGAYTGGAPDVVTQLRGVLPGGWRATLLAVDGATTRDLGAQLRRVPGDATHVVISTGGNDALQNIDLLDLRVDSSAAAFGALARRTAAFENIYRSIIREAATLGRDTTVCTIYNGALEPTLATAARVALTAFNDVILRTAVDFRLRAIELRSICTDPADYANPIEPSARGGMKIARAIARAVGAIDSRGPARVWGGE